MTANFMIKNILIHANLSSKNSSYDLLLTNNLLMINHLVPSLPSPKLAGHPPCSKAMELSSQTLHQIIITCIHNDENHHNGRSGSDQTNLVWKKSFLLACFSLLVQSPISLLITDSASWQRLAFKTTFQLALPALFIFGEVILFNAQSTGSLIQVILDAFIAVDASC